MPRYNQEKLYDQVTEIEAAIDRAESEFGACIERMEDAQYYFSNVLSELEQAKKDLLKLEDEINEEEDSDE